MAKTIAYLRPQDLRVNDSEPFIKIKTNSTVKIGITEERKLVVSPPSDAQVICILKALYSEGLWRFVATYTGNGFLIVDNKRLIKLGEESPVFHGSTIQINRFKYLLFMSSFTSSSDMRKTEEVSISDQHTVTITGDTLGKGAQSMVYYAYVTKRPDSKLSCKQTTLTDGYSIRSVGGVTRSVLFRNEVDILKRLSHPNVQMLIHSCEVKNSSNSSSFSRMFMPFCLYGTLKQYIDNSRVEKDRTARFLFYQIMLGLRYVHSEGYIHKDMKPDNILIDYKKGVPRAVITDFGLALKKSDAGTRTARLGTAIYNPPEALGRTQDYDEKVDCWASGIILFEMLTGGANPFLGDDGNDRDFEKRVLNQEPCMDYPFIQNENNYAKELILRLLEKQPEKRASCDDCIKSNWILDGNQTKDIGLHYPTIVKAFQRDRKHWFHDIKKQPYPNEQIKKPQDKTAQPINLPRWWAKLKQTDYMVGETRRPFLRKGTYAYGYKVSKWSTAKKGYIQGNLRQYLDGLVKALSQTIPFQMLFRTIKQIITKLSRFNEVYLK